MRLDRELGRNMLTTLLVLVTCVLAGVRAGYSEPLVAKFLHKIDVSVLVPGAERLGQIRSDIPVVPALKGDQTVGFVFLTSDFVTTTGYSGKPIHVVMAVDNDATVTGVNLVKHSEPIVLIGIPDAKIKAVIEKYAGLDLIAEAEAGGSAHDLDIVSGATVTIMVIDDSIVRAGLKVARQLGLGGLQAELKSSGPTKQLLRPTDADIAISDWQTLAGDGSVRSLRLDVGQVNQAFIDNGDERAIKRPEKGDPEATFIDMQVALVSAPEIGRTLLGAEEYANLITWLDDGEEAILVLGRGKYSFKGSGYVRGGIFDRIQLIQGDAAARFFDKQHLRLGRLAPDDAPTFTELDLFKVPADMDFDPTEPFRLQLLVQRAVGAIDKTFITFDLGYNTPSRFFEAIATTASGEARPPQVAGEIATSNPDELSHLWKRIWGKKSVEAGILVVSLVLLTGIFFFQMQFTRSERFVYWFRIGFLTFTLFGIGWYANAQLSVVNVLTFFAAVTTDFSWSAFLMDPLVFILWFSVAASLLFWGRGVFCGWLCPFGALQELTNKVARFFKVPQITVPWGVHERLWPVKYMVFLGLFGLSLYSLELAEQFAEVEPFKTAIILKFDRSWPYLLFVGVLLGAGLFIERFYCRYLCPLGAALAIPGRVRMFDWLKRYKECGDPCQRCAKDCFVQAIHPEGNINPNECLQCLHCQVLYQSTSKCPVCIKKLAKRQRFEARNRPQTILPTDEAAETASVPAE